MATFEAQIESLTGLAIESSGVKTTTQGQLTQFLRDAVTEVINRIIVLRPDEVYKFVVKTSSSSNAYTSAAGRILYVMREHDSTSVLRRCTEIDTSLQYEAANIESIHYRSKYNPAFYRDAGLIYAVPTATDTGNNRLQVGTVHYDTGIAFGDDEDNIANFPQEYGYLVTLNAACKALLNSMGKKASNLPSLALPPVPTTPTLSSNSVSFSATAPTYTAPTVAPDFGDANIWIGTEEDSEMSGARVQVIGAQLQDFQSQMQNELNNFNRKNAEYQASLQIAIQDAQLSSQDDSQILQKYQAELQSYQGEVGKEVQRMQVELGNLNADYQWLQGRYATLKQDYDSAFALLNPQQQQQQQRRQGER